MTSSALETGGLVAKKGAPFPRSAVGVALLLPALVFLIVFLVLPSLILLGYSALTQSQAGDISLPLTFASYERLIFSAAYRRVVILTLRVAFFTSSFTWLLAYPPAMVIAYGKPAFTRITMILAVGPLLVSRMVRTSGGPPCRGTSPPGGP